MPFVINYEFVYLDFNREKSVCKSAHRMHGELFIFIVMLINIANLAWISNR